MCQPVMENECQQFVDEYRLYGKLQAVVDLQGEITREMTELSRRENYGLPVHMHRKMRKRRTTPTLGFQGGVIGPVAGLLIYDDGQKIENEINELNQGAANLSHIVGRQSHIVKARFEELQEQLGAYEESQ